MTTISPIITSVNALRCQYFVMCIKCAVTWAKKYPVYCKSLIRRGLLLTYQVALVLNIIFALSFICLTLFLLQLCYCILLTPHICCRESAKRLTISCLSIMQSYNEEPVSKSLLFMCL